MNIQYNKLIQFLNNTEESVLQTPTVSELEPELEMFSASFRQGLSIALKDLINSRINNKPFQELDSFWVFIDEVNDVLSFNWYCDLFKIDPHKVRKIIQNQAKQSLVASGNSLI